jgi:hypothetical protein
MNLLSFVHSTYCTLSERVNDALAVIDETEERNELS